MNPRSKHPAPPAAAPLVRSVCVLCDKTCVPLADYDVPVCVGCDDTAALVLTAGVYADKAHAAAVALIPPRRRKYERSHYRGQAIKPCGTHSAFNRHKQFREAPDAACIEGEAAYQAARHRRRMAAA